MDKESDLWEDSFLPQERKFIRKERKRLQMKDASRLRKNGQQKSVYNPNSLSGLQYGVVQAIYSLTINVIIDGKEVACSLKGSLKKQTVQYKRPISVGDNVFVDRVKERGTIVSIEKRKNVLLRSDSLSGNKKHLIAANIDAVFISMSVVSPALKPSLIDRYLIAAIKGNLEPIILINKIDLLENEENKEEKALLKQLLKEYKQAGFLAFSVCANHPKTLAKLKKFMKGKRVVFSGQSGVGKSSIINALCKQDLKTDTIVKKTNKGKHTTRRAVLLSTHFGGAVIDTPGVKSFGLWDLNKEDVQLAFPEFKEYQADCKYSDCSHLEESGCRVKKALQDGKIKSFRYDSYCMLYMESTQKTKRYR